MAADAEGYELSLKQHEYAVWSQVVLLPYGTARPAVLTSRAKLNSAYWTE